MAQGSLGIGVSVFLRDQFTANAKKVNSSITGLHSKMMTMSKDSLRSIRNQNTAMLGLGAVAGMGMMKAAKNLGDFKDEMVFVKNVTKSNTEAMDVMMTKAMQLGKETMFSTQDVASGMRYLAVAGYDYEKVMGSITAATNLAGATMHDLGGKGGAADILTNIMTAFKIEAKDSELIADKLAKTILGTNIDLTDMGEGFKYVASTATQLKIPIEDTMVMLGLLNNEGVKGTMAGTSLANTWRYLAKAIGSFRTGNQDKALSQLGLSPEDFMTAQGGLKSTGEIIATLYKAASSKTDVEGVNLLEAIFGIRGARGLSPLLNQLKEYDNKVKEISGNNASGFSQTIMNERMGELKGLIDANANAWDAFMKRFTMGLEPLLKPMLKVFTAIGNVMEKIFSIPLLGTFISSAIAGFVAIKAVSATYKIILTSIGIAYGRATTGFATMVNSKVRGYKAMTAAATTYNMTAYGGFFGGVRATTGQKAVGYNVLGTPIRTRNTGFGKRGQILSQKPGGVYDRYNRRFGTPTGFMGTLGSLFGRFLPILSRFASFFMGPLGIALSFILPGAIGLLSDKLSKNTDALNKQTDKLETQLNDRRFDVSYNSQEGFLDRSINLERSKRQFRTPMVETRRGDTLNKDIDPNITIIVDGMESKIEKVTKKQWKTDISK